jgi:hypothetical protein
LTILVIWLAGRLPVFDYAVLFTVMVGVGAGADFGRRLGLRDRLVVNAIVFH